MDLSECRFLLHRLNGLRLRGVGLCDHIAPIQSACATLRAAGCWSWIRSIACQAARRIRIGGLYFRSGSVRLTCRSRPQHRFLDCARLQVLVPRNGGRPRAPITCTSSRGLLIHVPPAAGRQRQHSRCYSSKQHPFPGFLRRTSPVAFPIVKWQRASKLRNARLDGSPFFCRCHKRRHQFLQRRLLRAALGFFSKNQFLCRRRR